MADDMGERTEDPTPKRKSEARKSGNVAKSSDLGSAVMLLIGTVTLAVSVPWMLGQGKIMVAQVIGTGILSDPLDPRGVLADTAYVLRHAARVAAPVLLVVFVAAVISQLMQVGLLFTWKPIQPSLSKISPMKGAKRIFGLSGIVKAGLDSLKIIVIGTMVFITIRQYDDRFITLPHLALLDGLSTIALMMLDLAMRLLALLLIIGFIDFTYQKWKNLQDMKMTKQQVKDEMKQSDGDPQTKKRRFKVRQQIMMQRINSAVPQADVIVTNPEHISIAIKYDESKMAAPRVVAKGADFLALRIRQIATRHGIPIVERKPLARALYRDVEVGQEVPPDFYAAVAEVLAYVYRLDGRMAG